MRDVLVFVAGATPQIITETIYALLHKSPPVIPDEIYVITTKAGKDIIEKSLIDSDIIKEMANEYELPSIPLTKGSIIVVKDEEGCELSDIRNERDNEAVGNLITEFIREKTKDPGIRLHCSLAGGRKTMGFYLGSALQLFGRPWDKLYHVLVTPEFESNPKFFYKPKRETIIEVQSSDGSKRLVSTNQAQIELAELPFIRLADKLYLRSERFKDLIIESQKEIDLAYMQPSITVHTKDREIRIGTKSVKLVPVQMLIYITLLKRKLDMCVHPDRIYCLDCTQCYVTLTEFVKEDVLKKMATDYTRIYQGKKAKGEDLLEKWKKASIYEQIRQYIAKINSAIKMAFEDPSLTSFYQISSLRQYGSTKYGIKAEKSKIWIE
ncbi:MAG: CRISPR-associated ring nuclease Csm6 [Deltaproteobacteria bacterium]|nr:CRISPR-associated ring nuclease Csm6 [Deltaproteobacteria bacterium]